MRNIKTKIDINKQNYIKTGCMQNDDINLTVTLLENGVAYDLKNTTITLNWIKADNKFVIITSNRISVNNNIVTIKLLRDCTRAVGEAKLELVIKDNGSTQISTFPLFIDVIGSVLGSNEASKNVLTTIEDLENTIKEAEEDINKINAKGNETYFILSTAWVGTEPSLTYRLNHNLNSKSLIISVIDTDSQKSMLPDYKYIDMNNIEMQSMSKQNITVSINANYYSGKDANTVAQEVIDARKGEVSLKAKIDKIDNGKLDKLAKAESAKAADSVTWNNVTGKPATYPASMIVQDVSNRFITDAERTKWNMPSGTGYVKLPSGHVLQWGVIKDVNYIGKTINLIIAYTTALTLQATTGVGSHGAGAEFLSNSQIRVFNPTSDTPITHVYWFTLGIV